MKAQRARCASRPSSARALARGTLEAQTAEQAATVAGNLEAMDQVAAERIHAAALPSVAVAQAPAPVAIAEKTPRKRAPAAPSGSKPAKKGPAAAPTFDLTSPKDKTKARWEGGEGL